MSGLSPGPAEDNLVPVAFLQGLGLIRRRTYAGLVMPESTPQPDSIRRNWCGSITYKVITNKKTPIGSKTDSIPVGFNVANHFA